MLWTPSLILPVIVDEQQLTRKRLFVVKCQDPETSLELAYRKLGTIPEQKCRSVFFLKCPSLSTKNETGSR
jgi:hypothetical protein